MSSPILLISLLTENQGLGVGFCGRVGENGCSYGVKSVGIRVEAAGWKLDVV